MWILGGDADEEAGESSKERIANLVTGSGGEMVRNARWARRTLAHPIDGHREGSYFLANFTLDPSGALAVGRALEADQEIIRYLLLRRERSVSAGADVVNPDEEQGRGRRGEEQGRGRRGGSR